MEVEGEGEGEVDADGGTAGPGAGRELAGASWAGFAVAAVGAVGACLSMSRLDSRSSWSAAWSWSSDPGK